MSCPACGNDNLEGARFCGACGASLSDLIACSVRVGTAELPMVVFTAAIERAFRNYFRFSGRSTRAEYWWWVLFVSVAPTILGVVGAIIGVGGILNGLFSLVTLVPGFALGARRLHDIGRSGWWQLLWLVLIVGWAPLIVWAIKKGDVGQNKYGPDPRQTPEQ